MWWVWLAAALVLGLAEVLLPGFIFLGFAIAAVFMSALVLIAPELGAPAVLAVYAGSALLCWIGLRVVFKKQSSGARIVTRDINDN
ncbi:conserved domain protein [Roseobacter denitrificans OCh 114]|uniref:Conserved domain protein n=2 Tax=Roseobacter denitrificans TaxID=2434 RepID=Q164W7_ROSDO|nr:conserved domain protein [Roseobacter denitrificans OCh 114]